MPRCLLALALCLFTPWLSAAEPPARQLADQLLALTGTAAVLESPKVQAALADPQPFLGESGWIPRARLLAQAGLKRWQPPRVWILQSRTEDGAERWDNIGPFFASGVAARGYWLVGTAPLPAAEQAIASLTAGTPHPGLGTLLLAYEADALVLLRGQDWSLWTASDARQGRIPARPGLLPHVLAETLAALQQWPEAQGRPVVQVANVDELVDFVGVRDTLQALPGAGPLQLLRVTAEQAWFALAAPTDDALLQALDGEPRLPAAMPGQGLPLPAEVVEARRLACPLRYREWRPEALSPAVPGLPQPSASR